MKSQKNSWEGVTLVAMRNGKPVENQAEAVTALLRPVIATVLKHAGADLDAPAPAVLKTTEDRNRRISDLEIECATLMHGLRLADRRYEDAIAVQATSGQVSAESNDGELRRAVKQMTAMLADREWAEHISRDPDASALESALTSLIGELAAARDDSGYVSMPAKQEPKYGIRGGRLYNRMSGDKIPDNEPVFVFRAKDRKAVAALHFYAGICDNVEHINAVQSRIAEFQEFARRQPRMMKHPDSGHPNHKTPDERDNPL